MRTRPIALAIVLIIALAALALLILAGCGGGEREVEAGGDNGPVGDSGGRVIVPDADWEVAQDDEDDQEGTEDEESDADEDGNGSSEIVIEADTIEITMTVNGEPHPLDEPIFMHDGERADCEFLFKATGSELAYYEVNDPVPVSMPNEGPLSGYEATIPHQFTFNSRVWEDGGISLMVSNRRGSAQFRQIMVLPAQRPGFRRR